MCFNSECFAFSVSQWLICINKTLPTHQQRRYRSGFSPDSLVHPRGLVCAAGPQKYILLSYSYYNPFLFQSTEFFVFFSTFLFCVYAFRFRRCYNSCYEYICRALFSLTSHQKRKHNKLLCFPFDVLTCQKIICARRKNSVRFMRQYQCSRRSMRYSNMNCHTIFLRHMAAFHRAQNRFDPALHFCNPTIDCRAKKNFPVSRRRRKDTANIFVEKGRNV